MKALWARYAERIDSLTLRERFAIFGAIAVALVAVVYTFALEGPMRRERQLSSAIQQSRTETRALEAEIAKVAMSRGLDPDRQMREHLASIRKQLAEVEAQIVAEERKFTAPEQMRRVVEEMLARNRGVQLIAMRTLATTSIAEARAPSAPKPAAKPAPGGDRLIYRHGMEVTVLGGYLDLLRYLTELERLPTQLYWSSIELDATHYPSHRLKVVVYTLSLDPAWLSV